MSDESVRDFLAELDTFVKLTREKQLREEKQLLYARLAVGIATDVLLWRIKRRYGWRVAFLCYGFMAIQSVQAALHPVMFREFRRKWAQKRILT